MRFRSNLHVLSDRVVDGATETRLVERCVLSLGKVVIVEVGANPIQGGSGHSATKHRAIRVRVPSGSFNLASVGSSQRGDACDRAVTGSGIGSQPTANSSTMKGSQGLAG